MADSPTMEVRARLTADSAQFTKGLSEATKSAETFQGAATKYIERCYLKGNTVQDLQKAVHFLEKLIEIEQRKADASCGDGSEPTRGYVNQD